MRVASPCLFLAMSALACSGAQATPAPRPPTTARVPAGTTSSRSTPTSPWRHLTLPPTAADDIRLSVRVPGGWVLWDSAGFRWVIDERGGATSHDQLENPSTAVWDGSRIVVTEGSDRLVAIDTPLSESRAFGKLPTGSDPKTLSCSLGGCTVRSVQGVRYTRDLRAFSPPLVSGDLAITHASIDAQGHGYGLAEFGVPLKTADAGNTWSLLPAAENATFVASLTTENERLAQFRKGLVGPTSSMFGTALGDWISGWFLPSHAEVHPVPKILGTEERDPRLSEFIRSLSAHPLHDTHRQIVFGQLVTHRLGAGRKTSRPSAPHPWMLPENPCDARTAIEVDGQPVIVESGAKLPVLTDFGPRQTEHVYFTGQNEALVVGTKKSTQVLVVAHVSRKGNAYSVDHEHEGRLLTLAPGCRGARGLLWREGVANGPASVVSFSEGKLGAEARLPSWTRRGALIASTPDAAWFLWPGPAKACSGSACTQTNDASNGCRDEQQCPTHAQLVVFERGHVREVPLPFQDVDDAVWLGELASHGRGLFIDRNQHGWLMADGGTTFVDAGKVPGARPDKSAVLCNEQGCEVEGSVWFPAFPDLAKLKETQSTDSTIHEARRKLAEGGPSLERIACERRKQITHTGEIAQLIAPPNAAFQALAIRPAPPMQGSEALWVTAGLSLLTPEANGRLRSAPLRETSFELGAVTPLESESGTFYFANGFPTLLPGRVTMSVHYDRKRAEVASWVGGHVVTAPHPPYSDDSPHHEEDDAGTQTVSGWFDTPHGVAAYRKGEILLFTETQGSGTNTALTLAERRSFPSDVPCAKSESPRAPSSPSTWQAHEQAVIRPCGALVPQKGGHWLGLTSLASDSMMLWSLPGSGAPLMAREGETRAAAGTLLQGADGQVFVVTATQRGDGYVFEARTLDDQLLVGPARTLATAKTPFDLPACSANTEGSLLRHWTERYRVSGITEDGAALELTLGHVLEVTETGVCRHSSALAENSTDSRVVLSTGSLSDSSFAQGVARIENDLFEVECRKVPAPNK